MSMAVPTANFTLLVQSRESGDACTNGSRSWRRMPESFLSPVVLLPPLARTRLASSPPRSLPQAALTCACRHRQVDFPLRYWMHLSLAR
jgi:hypothetical protein